MKRLQKRDFAIHRDTAHGTIDSPFPLYRTFARKDPDIRGARPGLLESACLGLSPSHQSASVLPPRKGDNALSTVRLAFPFIHARHLFKRPNRPFF